MAASATPWAEGIRNLPSRCQNSACASVAGFVHWSLPCVVRKEGECSLRKTPAYVIRGGRYASPTKWKRELKVDEFLVEQPIVVWTRCKDNGVVPKDAGKPCQQTVWTKL